MIYGMMRIKNEARWIERVLRSMLPVCERIFILDDHSTDGTVKICESFPQASIFLSPFDGIEETRDKNFLLEKVEHVAQPGDWIVSIDGDEEIVAEDIDTIRMLASREGPQDSYRFHVLYLWNAPDRIRIDGIYRTFARPSMFRLNPGARFHSTAGGGFHCGNVPEPRHIGISMVRLLHYGYMHKEDRIRKFEWYNAPDKQPVPESEDGYRHMVIGDVFPMDSRFRWGGPLQLAALCR